MNMKNISYFLLAGLAITFLFGTGRHITEEDKTMAFASSQSTAQTKPLLDEQVPAATKTATLAMG